MQVWPIGVCASEFWDEPERASGWVLQIHANSGLDLQILNSIWLKQYEMKRMGRKVVDRSLRPDWKAPSTSSLTPKCLWHMTGGESFCEGRWKCEKWELDHKEDWALKNWCFLIVVVEKTLENPLDFKEIKPVNPKGNHSHWNDLCWSWSFNTLATWWEELTHWKRP